MGYLLDRFVTSPVQIFRPSNIGELFSFRLAQKLNDLPAVHHYVRLLEHYSQDLMVCAYRRVTRSANHLDLGKLFLHELNRLPPKGYGRHQSRLLSIRIERRTVAAAVFAGEHLEFTDARQLSSVHDKAVSSANGFINWLLEHFAVESAALETIPAGQDVLRSATDASIRQVLRERGIALWEISKAELMDSCGYPSLKSRGDLRSIATAIWPVLSDVRSKAFVQDAAALGIHVQIERLFIIN